MNTKTNKKKLTLLFVGMLLVLSVLIGFSYSFYKSNVTNRHKIETSLQTKLKNNFVYTR